MSRATRTCQSERWVHSFWRDEAEDSQNCQWIQRVSDKRILCIAIGGGTISSNVKLLLNWEKLAFLGWMCILFPRIPFTIQRLCELLTEPKRNYTGTDKFLRGVEKVFWVFICSSTIMPFWILTILFKCVISLVSYQNDRKLYFVSECDGGQLCVSYLRVS